MQTVALTCLLMSLMASSASAVAGGLNLGWLDCGGTPATLNRTFACNTNTGNHTLVGSFVAPSFVTAMVGDEIILDLQSAGASWPAWWGFRTGLCRSGSLSGDFNFTAGPFTCHDYWQGAGVGGVFMDPPAGNRARIKAVVALAQGDPLIGPIAQGTEVYSFKVRINNARTVGLGACSGCPTPVCIVLNSINIVQPLGNPNGNKFISAPAVRNFVTWQGAIGVDCLLATPARNTTWGGVKAIYR